MAQTLSQLAAEMPRLELSVEPSHPPEALAYFRLYRIEFPDVRHFFGSFQSSGYRLAAHAWIPSNPKGTVFVLHGYLDHTGLLRPLIEHLLRCGFAVAAYDLPGHGLSSGERGAVDDFSDYVAVLRDFLRMCDQRLPKPFHLVGHSTGCAVAFEYLSTSKPPTFDKVIFLAPLVRSAHWILSKAATLLAEPFVEAIPRRFRDNTSDQQYLRFVRQDPLRILEVPLRWVKALYSWNERLQGNEAVAHSVLIIQGTGDQIVDWEYNVPFLEDRIRPATVEWIAGAKHQLVNERSELQHKVLSLIEAYLAGPTP